METQTCTKCGKDKPLAAFSRANKGSEKRRRQCNQCRSSQKRNGNLEKYRTTDRMKAQKKRKEDLVGTILTDSRKSDRKKSLSNNLTKEFLSGVLSQPCSYCGETTLRMTLDRIDNSLGHLQSNVVPACIRCNYARRAMPHKAWLCLVPGMREARGKGLFGDWTGRCR